MAKKKQNKSKARVTRKSGASQKQGLSTQTWFIISAVVAVVLVGGLFYLGTRGTAANRNIQGVDFFGDPGRGHFDGDLNYEDIVPIAFIDIPPGGAHNAVWQNCGIYDEPIRTENAIHSMEHGAVWITYQPDLPEDQVEMLRDVTRQARRNRGEAMVLLSPHEGLEDPIVLSAWRVQLRTDNASDERITDFVQAYQRGPFTPEPGATCGRGIGNPIN